MWYNFILVTNLFTHKKKTKKHCLYNTLYITYKNKFFKYWKKKVTFKGSKKIFSILLPNSSKINDINIVFIQNRLCTRFNKYRTWCLQNLFLWFKGFLGFLENISLLFKDFPRNSYTHFFTTSILFHVILTWIILYFVWIQKGHIYEKK